MWNLTCKLCPEAQPFTGNDLVQIQEHAMQEHGVTVADLRAANSKPNRGTPGAQHFQYSLPDGRLWLDARKVD